MTRRATPTTHDLELACRVCRRTNDATTNADGNDAQPSDGAVSICWRCGCISIFVGTPPTALRAPTLAEQLQIRDDPTIQSLLATIGNAPDPFEAIRRVGGRS